MKRKKESESEIEPMTMAHEPKGIKTNPVKAKPMPKKVPAELRKPSMDEPEQKRQKVAESPKWDPRKQKSCFFCGEESHKAMYCEAMAKLALELGGSVPSMEDRRKANAGLFCFLVCKDSPTPMTGWGNHTHQRCRSWKEREKEEEKLLKAKEAASPKPPSPKWGAEQMKRKAESLEPNVKAMPKGAGPHIEEVTDDDKENAKEQDEMIDLEKKDPDGIKWSFPEKEEERKAKMAMAKTAKESIEKKQASKDAKKGKKESKGKKEKKDKRQRPQRPISKWKTCERSRM